MITEQPFYCSGNSQSCLAEASDNRLQFENELIQGGVALVISKGGERYERTHPIANGETVESTNTRVEVTLDNPIYITMNGISVNQIRREEYISV
jgi:hypothetical protein